MRRPLRQYHRGNQSESFCEGHIRSCTVDYRVELSSVEVVSERRDSCARRKTLSPTIASQFGASAQHKHTLAHPLALYMMNHGGVMSRPSIVSVQGSDEYDNDCISSCSISSSSASSTGSIESVPTTGGGRGYDADDDVGNASLSDDELSYLSMVVVAVKPLYHSRHCHRGWKGKRVNTAAARKAFKWSIPSRRKSQGSVPTTESRRTLNDIWSKTSLSASLHQPSSQPPMVLHPIVDTSLVSHVPSAQFDATAVSATPGMAATYSPSPLPPPAKRARLLEPYATPLSLLSSQTVHPRSVVLLDPNENDHVAMNALTESPTNSNHHNHHHHHGMTVHVATQPLAMEQALALSTKPHVLLEATAPHRVWHANAAFGRLVATTAQAQATAVSTTANNSAVGTKRPLERNCDQQDATSSPPTVWSQIQATFGPHCTVTLYPVSGVASATTTFGSSGSLTTSAFQPRHYLVEVESLAQPPSQLAASLTPAAAAAANTNTAVAPTTTTAHAATNYAPPQASRSTIFSLNQPALAVA
jgi:hypothetical protein